uniref:MAT1 centre domain-containing protein n=1 Tax=Chrysotila carterae TaxID=13221 RepID=A0A7S4C0G4_CHRCT|mmetsp:Transcript_28232/g.59289  ORF Transcript_28232/g.59289 Transcript_28232/m.59289 type:complete len:267 (+) Transcript_28232:253-1053(+)
MDASMEREKSARREVRSLWYRREEDFAELRDYNDYLETVEEIVAGLLDDAAKPATQARLKALGREGRELTARNRAKFDAERRALLELAERERGAASARAEAAAAAEASANATAARVRAEMQDDIAAGRLSAAAAQGQLREAKAKALAAQAAADDSGYQYVPVQGAEPAEVLVQPLVPVEEGDKPKFLLSSINMEKQDYEDDPVRFRTISIAGGHLSDLWRTRYTQEAFSPHALAFTPGGRANAARGRGARGRGSTPSRLPLAERKS